MPKRIRACFQWLKKAEMTAGKVTLFAVLTGAVLATTTFLAYFQVFTAHTQANADNVNTSVTVLNTPPTWVVNAHEEFASATTTPTSVVQARLAFRATAVDSSADNYFLIICKTNVAPTANPNAPPVCNGGMGNQWAISATTTGDPNTPTEAVAATTTREVATWATESNDWYGWVCDSVLTLPRCYSVYTNSDPTDTGPSHTGFGTGFPDSNSPFVINHPPVFSAIGNNSPQDPGSNLTWTATATDTDHLRGVDPIALFVCKSASFSTSTNSGCNGGAWATSTFQSFVNSVATSTPIPIPYQDKAYNAFVYVADQYNLGATSTNQGTASNFVVRNVAPSVDGSTVSLVGTTTNLQLFTPASTSGPYQVRFVVADNNSCLNSSSGNEIVSATTSIYRSGLGASACQTNLDYNTNRCYPSVNTLDSMNPITCVQDTTGAVTGNACSGATDATVGWYCTFNLWFNADPTTANSSSSAETWKAGVQVIDDNFASSTLSTSTTGTELEQFLAFDVTQTSIAYGGLQPGDQIDPLSVATSTDLKAQGNVGLDEWLNGDTMCPNWLNQPDFCDHAWGAGGIATGTATSTITVWNQKFATSALTYALATMLSGSTSPTYFPLQVAKTLSTSSIKTKNTLWAIRVPSSITRAGDYSGVNTIYAAVSNFNYW